MNGITTFTLAAMLLLSVTTCTQAGTATVVLPGDSMTSAAVYDAPGRLVRTLWSGQRRPPGAVAIEWDGKDDDGAVVDPAQRFVVRVLAHEVRHVWEGVIGNSSSDASGAHVHRAFGPINDMAIDSKGNGFYVVGYNEQQPALHRFQAQAPGRKISMAHDDYLRVFRYAATDGNLVYFANAGGEREPESFVVALRVEDGAEHRFADGKTVMPGQQWGNRWASVIDHIPERGQGASGLAVQRNGELLFVAHRSANEIRVFNKHSGRPIGHVRVPAPGEIDMAPDGSFWVIRDANGQRVVAHYEFSDGSWSSTTQISDGVGEPVSLGVSPLDGSVLVADAATEQLKAFDVAGIPLWTHGIAAGYRSGPEVTTDKLWLSAGPTYVAFEPDGSFWVGDAGNVRNLHFSAQRRYLGQILYLPASYVVTVDPGNPTRVFRHFLEFSVDYTKPIRDSWRLERNWAAGLDKRYLGQFEGFESVHTLSNRRAYGVVRRPGVRVREVFELTATGLRDTGGRVEEGEKLYPDGSRRFHQIRFGSLNVYERPLAGFDAAGNPRWDSPRLLAAATRLSDRDPYYHDVPEVPAVNGVTYPETGDGLIVSFNPGKSSGFHLGGLHRARDGWAWRASPAGRWEVDQEGRITTLDGRYETGNGVQYPGNVVMANGRHIVYGYHGEAWNGGQANQWLHFLDNGLFVGQFGRPVYPATNRSEALPESAGNAFSPQLVNVGGNLYLWHNDESVHGGLHRWRIGNTASIRLLEAAIAPTATGTAILQDGLH